MVPCEDSSGVYYDRSLPEPLLALLAPRGPMAWLVQWVRSPYGEKVMADLHFRRSSNHPRGSIQLYTGGTAVLEIVSRPRGKFSLRPARFATTVPTLFGTDVADALLHGLQDLVREYLDAVVGDIPERWLCGEAALHGRFMRRYTLQARTGDPLVAVDREVVIGHPKTEERKQVDLSVRSLFGAGAANHRELDAIGFTSDGRVCLVEIKPEASPVELQTAALQTAAHIRRFQLLDAAPVDWQTDLSALADQKFSVDLLSVRHQSLPTPAAPIPVIAAPDDSSSWADRWRSAVSPVRNRVPVLLANLRLWRLDRDTGVVVEQEHA
jgi:hypothetical protein